MIKVSDILKQRDDPFIRDVLLPLQGKLIDLPDKFVPDLTLLARHREDIFLTI
jgi:hypothetical protein